MYALEVKRNAAGNEKIDEDLRRLAAIVERTDDLRAFLCVASEAQLPKRFVSTKGFRKTSVIPLEGTDSSYQVTGVFKASPYLNSKKIDKAHYCCVIEVFANGDITDEESDAED